MNSLSAFDYTCQGMTFDERMALRRLFTANDDSTLQAEQTAGSSLAEESSQ